MSYVPANENRDILLFVGLVVAVGGLASFLLRGKGDDPTVDEDSVLSHEARMLEPDPEIDAREYQDLSIVESSAAS